MFGADFAGSSSFFQLSAHIFEDFGKTDKKRKKYCRRRWQGGRRDRSRRNFGRLPKMKMEAYPVFLWSNCRVDEPRTDLSSFYSTFLSFSFFLPRSRRGYVPRLVFLFPILPTSSHLDLEASPGAPEIRRRFQVAFFKRACFNRSFLVFQSFIPTYKWLKCSLYKKLIKDKPCKELDRGKTHLLLICIRLTVVAARRNKSYFYI